ncbi:MAG: mevalonate kinase, partial [Candidatus Diapherotrites archaeon]|nr:mevalonate kinase [Candidatus Diapherotrites archaeon]
KKIKGSDYVLEDNRPATPGYKQEKAGQQKESLNLIFKKMNITPAKTPVKITLSGDLIAASGVGASAASCCAVARALNEEFGLGLTIEQINEVAYEGEKGYHGTPSGLDNTAAVYGGLIWFQKEPSIMDKMTIPKPFEIVLGDTGKTSDTKFVVGGVAERKKANPQKFEKIFSEYKLMISEAKKVLLAGNLKKIGELMNKNQELLREIGVSSPELEQLIKLALDNGAFGAKLTGTGVGGLMIALTPGKELQEKVAKAMEKAGFRTIRTTIG